MMLHEPDFVEWFNDLLHKHGWSMRSLARAAGVSRSTISDVALGVRRPSLHFCIAMAMVFQIPVNEFLYHAGFRSLPRRKEAAQRVVDILPLLDDESLEVLRKVAESLVHVSKKLAPPIPIPPPPVKGSKSA